MSLFNLSFPRSSVSPSRLETFLDLIVTLCHHFHHPHYFLHPLSFFFLSFFLFSFIHPPIHPSFLAPSFASFNPLLGFHCQTHFCRWSLPGFVPGARRLLVPFLGSLFSSQQIYFSSSTALSDKSEKPRTFFSSQNETLKLQISIVLLGRTLPRKATRMIGFTIVRR